MGDTWTNDPSVASWLGGDTHDTTTDTHPDPAAPHGNDEHTDTPVAYSDVADVRGGGGADAPTEQFARPPEGDLFPAQTGAFTADHPSLGLMAPAAKPQRGRGRLTEWARRYRWPLGAVAGVVLLLVVAGGAVSAFSGSDVAPAPSGPGIQIPSGSEQAPATAAAADCPTRTQGPVSTGRDAGGTGNGVDVIKAFEHAYYVERSGAKARALVTPSAKFSTAEQLQASIDSSIDPQTLHCVSITDRGTGLYAVQLTETPPRGETPVTYHQLIQTTTDQGRTWIVSIVKDPAAPTS